MKDKKIIITKADGAKEEFHPEKLKRSLKNSGASERVVDSIVDHIVDELEDGMSTKDIYHHAFSLLKRFEEPVAVRYSLRRAIAELGPSGYPFEKFVAEIFKAKGYQTLTNQIVKGGCIEHEVDVVAWNERKLIMSEVKFHNEFGLKSDVKVALYVKSRFDDLKEKMYDYGGKDRHLDEGWLITNTKFTDMAIKYAECKNLKLVGWNYPLKGNLHHMIEDTNLHPITSLTSLTQSEKNELIQNNIVLCQHILKDPKILDKFNLSQEKKNLVITESGVLCPTLYI